jgi:hypothetical protein
MYSLMNSVGNQNVHITTADSEAIAQGTEPSMDGFNPPRSVGFRLDGRIRADWQEKWLLIMDEVSILERGRYTL